jgi:hypothetical protein
MSNATSIVGTWNGFVAWGDSGPPVSNATTVWTFNADGSWTYELGGGRWFQVEGLGVWNFTDGKEPAGLVYTVTVTRNAIDGMMGYANAGTTHRHRLLLCCTTASGSGARSDDARGP